jgi:histidinol-phosphate phosphatase family protein
VLPSLVASNARIAVYNTPEYLRDVGSSTRHALAEGDIAAGRVGVLNKSDPRPAIFFDCDGVLNEEPGLQGAVTASDIKIIPGAGAAVRRAREAGQLTVAVTNRPQVAKGLVTFDGLSHILGRLEALLAADGGILDRLYFCPHHPESGFRGEISALKVRCECRKPGTLLLRRALKEMPIERRRSSLIGDSLRDIGAATGLGIWAYGVRTGYGCRDGERYPREFGAPPAPDLMFQDVSEAVDFVVDYEAKVAPALGAIRNLLAAGREPVLVGVCGRSRSGKTAVAHAIVRALSEQGVSSLHIRLDHWIVPVAERESNSSAETRNRVDVIPDVIRDLRAGASVCAPGYDAASRGPGEPETYDPAGRSVILLDGGFAAHVTILEMLDYNVFTAVPNELQQQRFVDFYRWKGFAETAIETLWRERTIDEWPAVDAQQRDADLILAPTGGCS